MKVSVVIPTYNHANYLAEAVERVFAQSHEAIELVVVDDGSVDATADVLRAYGDRVRVIVQQNRGVAAARNAGAHVSSGDFLAFLDADDSWLPTKVARQIALFEKDQQLGLVHCGVAEVDSRGRQTAIRLDGMEGSVFREMLLLRRAVILGGGSAAVVPRKVFEYIGGFDETLSTSADWDFYCRIARRYCIGFVPEVLVRYRIHHNNMHRNVHAMAKDMLSAYAKAFLDADVDLKKVRRRAYGRLHAVLAGSFFHVGAYGRFTRHALSSIVRTPESTLHFAGYPIRKFRRRRGIDP